MSEGPPLRKPQAAWTGSSGTGRRITVSWPPRVSRTLSPGFSPSFFRKGAGMTTCPLADVVTIGIDVHLPGRHVQQMRPEFNVNDGRTSRSIPGGRKPAPQAYGAPDRCEHSGARRRASGGETGVGDRRDLAEFLPALRLGDLVHAGKGTTFGLGRYTVRGATASPGGK